VSDPTKPLASGARRAATARKSFCTGGQPPRASSGWRGRSA